MIKAEVSMRTEANLNVAVLSAEDESYGLLQILIYEVTLQEMHTAVSQMIVRPVTIRCAHHILRSCPNSSIWGKEAKKAP